MSDALFFDLYGCKRKTVFMLLDAIKTDFCNCNSPHDEHNTTIKRGASAEVPRSFYLLFYYVVNRKHSSRQFNVSEDPLPLTWSSRGKSSCYLKNDSLSSKRPRIRRARLARES